MPTNHPCLYILDANALLHRAWHAIPPLTSPDGKIVNAVYGVLMAVMKLLNEKKPDAFVACWDTEAATFRHIAYKEYKATREEKPQELYDQIPWLQEGLALLGVPSLAVDGYEADDLLGTIAYRAKNMGWDATIVTGDRDALQLVQPGISVLAFKKGVSETIVFDEEEVKKQYGLTPEQFLEYKAMRGDPSDNIPGIRGIGEKGATDLLQRFGNLKKIFQAAHDTSSDLSPSIRAKLLSAELEMPDIMKLVTIVTDAPVEYVPIKGSAGVQDDVAVRTYLLKYGFKTLMGRVPGSSSLRTSEKSEAVSGMKEKRPRRAVSRNDRSELEDVRLEHVEDAMTAIEEARGAGEFVVHVAEGAKDSLFAGQVEGLILGARAKISLFSSAVLANKTVASSLASLLNDPATHKVAHDAKAQLVLLEKLGLSVEGWSFDTMLAAYVLGAGERNYDLASVAHRYADLSLPEDASPFREAEAIMMLSTILKNRLQEEKLESILTRFELPLVPVLRDMERTGIQIDKGYLAKLAVEMQKDKEVLEKKMMKSAGREFNPASPAQLADVLFTDLKLSTKGIKKGKTGYSTAAPELEKLRGAHAIIEMIEDHRELAKLLSTYVETLPTQADHDSRVHTTYNQAIAATGRLSSINPNLQNIPIRTELGRHIRRAFVAPAGYRLLSCDYSQIELRLVAALAKDEAMLAAFKRGDDIHTVTAAAIWGIPESDVTKDQRRAAKAINFGLIYGQGPMGLAQSAGISFADAKKFIAAYFGAYPGIKRYMDETKALAMKLGYVETLFGRRRPLPEIQSMMPQLRAQAERMAINMPVQGTSADLIKLAMIKLAPILADVSPKARMLLQVHDELVFEVPEKDMKKVALFAKDMMENVENVGVPIVVDTKAGENWEEMETV